MPAAEEPASPWKKGKKQDLVSCSGENGKWQSELFNWKECSVKSQQEQPRPHEQRRKSFHNRGTKRH